jgi:RimJ/RimL family protein N-acetyltransferase
MNVEGEAWRLEEPKFPALETVRLRLRGLRPGDEEFLASLDSDPRVMEHIHEGPLPYEKALRYAHAQVQGACFRRHWGKWMVESHDGGQPLGWVEVGNVNGRYRDDLQVGYEFAPGAWGRGYATEAAGRVIEYMFEEIGLDRLVAIAREANPASLRVLSKLGFRRAGRRRDRALVWCPAFRLTAEAWRARRSRAELAG